MDRAELNTLAATLPTSEHVTEKTLLGVMRYLDEFGYLDEFKDLPAGDPAFAIPDVETAVREAQLILGVEVDGVPGEQTLKAIQTVPRCGCKDYGFARDQINKWSRTVADRLDVCTTDYLPEISQQKQKDITVQALESWERVGNFQTRLISNPAQAHLIISCSGSRREEFGQAGNVLAWCELPQGGEFAGKLMLKLDTAERWALTADDPGTLLLAVLAHEFGHAWGLDHTPTRGELMFAMYTRGLWAPQPRYDIPAFVERYGAVVVVVPPGPVPPGAGGIADIEVTLRDKVTGATRVL